MYSLAFVVNNTIRYRPRTLGQLSWLAEFFVDFDSTRCSKLHGLQRFGHLMGHVENLREFENKLAKIEEETQLKAKYVREYIYELLEFYPGDWFRPNGEGHWVIDEAAFQAIPHKVKRFIKDFRLCDGGQIAVQFISKEKALELAARFTLIQKVENQNNSVPWHELARAAILPRDDELNKRIAAVGPPLNGAAH